MKPVDQDKFGHEGNCFQACIASLLELSLGDLPRNQGEILWWLKDRGWLYVEVWRGNLRQLKTDDPPREERDIGWQPLLWGDALCILCGPSPRFPGMSHAVVGNTNGYRFTTVHDPHPDRTGLRDVERIGFLVQPDPLGLRP